MLKDTIDLWWALAGLAAIFLVAIRDHSLRRRLSLLQSQFADTNHQLELSKHQIAQLPTLTQQLTNHQELTVQLRIALAKAQQQIEQLERLPAQLVERDAALEQSRYQLSEKQSQIAQLSTRLEEQQRHSEQKLQLLTEARADLTQQFKALAHEIFDEKGRQSGEQLNRVLTPFREQLHDFKKKVDEVYINDVRERATLKQELENLRQLNQQMNHEAVNLARALKGDTKIQGNWGELILERVLEQSGLRRGTEFEIQSGYRDGDQRLLRPDVIVHLPDNKDVIIDSKVSLRAYERYCNEEEPGRQRQALQEHVQAVRQHITLLSDKDYSALEGLRSLDFVLLFMPIEAAFLAAFQADDGLFTHAFERHIVVVSPTTLLATLRTIENIWRYERQNQNAQAISERAGAVYDKLRGFVEEMEKFGIQLATLDATYNVAMNKLSQGRGNLISQASRFVDLGVKVRKPLPKTILERAELENDPEDHFSLR